MATVACGWVAACICADVSVLFLLAVGGVFLAGGGGRGMFGGGGIMRLMGLLTLWTLAFALGGATEPLKGGTRLPCEGVPTAAALLLTLLATVFSATDEGEGGEGLLGGLTGGEVIDPGGGGGGLLAGYFVLRSPAVV